MPTLSAQGYSQTGGTDLQSVKSWSLDCTYRHQFAAQDTVHITAVLNEPENVKVNGRERTVTKLEAVTRQLVDKAVQGDPRVMQQLLAEIHKNEAKAEQTEAAQVLEPADKKVMAALYARLARDAVEKAKG